MPQTFYDFRYDFVGQDWTTNIVRDIELISAENAYVQIALIRLLVPRGSYVLNPDLGSDLYVLKRSKRTSITEEQVKLMVENALKPEIDAGNIENVSVILDPDSSPDGVIVHITMGVVGGNPINVNLLLGT